MNLTALDIEINAAETRLAGLRQLRALAVNLGLAEGEEQAPPARLGRRGRR